MKKRLVAWMLMLVLLVGLFAGCGDQSASSPDGSGKPSKTENQENTSSSVNMGKLAFKAQWIPLEVDEAYQLEYVNSYVIGSDAMYFYGDCVIGEEPLIDADTGEPIVDEATGEPYMNSIYETCLFKMDLSSHAVTRMDGYTPYEIPEGCEGNSYLRSMQLMKDGTLWLIEQANTYSYDVPENFDEETDNIYNYYVAGESMVRLHKIDASGQEVEIVELKLEPETYMDTVILDEDGTIYGTNWESILLYDTTGQLLGSVALENGVNQLMLMDDGMIYGMFWTEDGGYWLRPVEKETLSLGEGYQLHTNAYTIYPGTEGYDYIFDYNGTFYGVQAGSEEPEKLFAWLDCDVDSSNVYSTVFGADGCVYSLESSYDNAAQRSRYQLVVLNPVDPATLPVKQELTLACQYLPWDLSAQIIQFNRAHDDVRIVVKDYSQYATNDDGTAGLQKLSTELMSGVAPDIFLLSAGMPISQYEAKGYLQDLWPLIDSDSELSREDLMSHFFDALSVDGKLYQITDGFTISTLAGKESVVGSGSSWTMEELMAALDSQPEGTSIFGYYDTKSSILESLVSRNADGFIDWQSLSCGFDSPEFAGYLEFANRFPEEIDYDSFYEDPNFGSVSDAALLRSGKQMLYSVNMYSFADLVYANAVFGEKVNFIGYPTSTGNSSCFNVNTSLAISSSCSNTEAAWEFVRTWLTEEHQSEYVYDFPTNRHAFEAMTEKAMTMQYENDASYGEPRPIVLAYIWYSENEDAVELYTMSQEEYELFMEIYEGCTSFYSSDTEITELIADEAAAFFSGQKTAEETARLIQDRVSLYVMENG